MLKRVLFLIFWIFSLLAFAGAVRAETVTFQQGVNGYAGNSTTYIDRWNPDTNWGTYPTAAVRPNYQNIVLKFDLSSLATNAYVQNATLRIFVVSKSNANQAAFRVYKILKDWSENETTWHRANNLNEWDNVGARGVYSDRSDAPTVSLDIPSSDAFYTFDLTSLVRQWIAYPSSNKGAIIAADSPGNVGFSVASDNNGFVDRRPMLSLDYSVSGDNDFPPEIQITSPVHQTFLTNSFNISINASDDRGIQRVDYFLDNNQIGSANTAPYQLSFDTANSAIGQHILKAIAVDTNNQTAQFSEIVNIYRLDNNVLTIAQITDTHVGTSAFYEPPDKTLYTQRFQQAIAEINNVVKPAVILHAGDATTILDDYSGQLYQSIVSPSQIPVKIIPGNHDLSYPENFLYYMGPARLSFDIGPHRFIGYTVNQLDRNWADNLLSSTDKKGLIFSHYLIRLPLGSTADPDFYTMSPAERTDLQQLMSAYAVPAYLSGHLHQDFLLEDSVSHAVEIGGPALSSKGTYEIITSDNGLISNNVKALGDWPAIVITSPQRYYPDGGIKEISGEVKIRVKVYDDSPVTSVVYKIDDSGIFSPMDNIGNGVWEKIWDSSLKGAGIHQIIVNASDSAQRSKSTQILVKVRGLDVAVNAGGQNSLVWQTDKMYTNGSWGHTSGQTYSTNQTIGNTTPEDGVVYQTERWGNFSYKFDVNNGQYDVFLKFAEIYGRSCSIGNRIFNVKIEGQPFLTNFDVFKEAGCYKTVDKTTTVNVTDSTLNIDFITIANSAKISAIRVVSRGSVTPTPTPTPTPTATPTATPTPPQSAATRVNSGGPSYTDQANNLWSADTGYTGGNTYSASTTQIISGTNDQTIYKTERFNMSEYKFNVINGTYLVTLKFAEIYYINCSAGKRVFGVKIENQTVLNNFDIAKEVGGCYRALDKTFNTTVNDGVLNIDFVTITNAPKINGIEIRF